MCVIGDKTSLLVLWCKLQKQGQTEYLDLRSSDYGFIFFVVFLADTWMTLGGHKVIKLILFHLRCLDWWSCLIVSLPFNSVLIYTLCLDSGDSNFSSVHSQTLPLFTRGIIQHMATVCHRCQIAHKEWLHSLLGEMAANWCSPLLVECYQRTQSSYWMKILLFAIKRKLQRAWCSGIGISPRMHRHLTSTLLDVGLNRYVVYLVFLMFLTIILWLLKTCWLKTSTKNLSHLWLKKKKESLSRRVSAPPN